MSAADGDVVFDWRLARHHGELTTLLTDDYTGLWQSDGYDAFVSYVEDQPDVTWLGCWAHARRYFFEAQGEPPHPPGYRREREWDEQSSRPSSAAAPLAGDLVVMQLPLGAHCAVSM